MDWVNSHGFELLVAAYVYSLVVSSMPPISESAGWWTKFAHNIAQVTAANADRVVKSSPVMQRFTSKEQSANGATKEEELVTSVPAKSPA